jgi:hypothetical protein
MPLAARTMHWKLACQLRRPAAACSKRLNPRPSPALRSCLLSLHILQPNSACMRPLLKQGKGEGGNCRHAPVCHMEGLPKGVTCHEISSLPSASSSAINVPASTYRRMGSRRAVVQLHLADASRGLRLPAPRNRTSRRDLPSTHAAPRW